jgi:hypothetical protein
MFILAYENHLFLIKTLVWIVKIGFIAKSFELLSKDNKN